MRTGKGELDLIESIRRRFDGVGGSRGGVTLGIGDDCAILRPPTGWEVLVTTDFLLEGRHFRRDTHPAASAGYRCLARGLSDVAAMGGRPVAAFLSLALPRSMTVERTGRVWIEGFLAGLRELAERTGTALAGGDTAEAPGEAVLADVVLVGAAPQGKALRRSGARAGDRLFVTGSLGGAAAELQGLFRRSEEQNLRVALPRGWQARALAGLHPQLFPQPRMEVGEVLRRRGLATAAIDLSDGLSTDLAHLCRASGVRAEVWEAALPVHGLARPMGAAAMAAVLHGGEDYELLFTSTAGKRVPKQVAGVAVTEIGRVLPEVEGEPRVTLVGDDGRKELEPNGWEHFRER